MTEKLKKGGRYLNAICDSDFADHLAVGQSIYLASEDTVKLSSSEIVLREYGVGKVLKSGTTVRIVDKNGKMNTFSLFAADTDFCIGSARVGRRELYGFPSEEDFWDWWECKKLSELLPSKIVGKALAPPTVETLQLFRNIYELLLRKEQRFQNISCLGCAGGSIVRCSGCVRQKGLKDYWVGRNPPKRFLFE